VQVSTRKTEGTYKNEGNKEENDIKKEKEPEAKE
jgi:hypothetical protein